MLETVHEVGTHVGHTFDAFNAENIAQSLLFFDGPYAVAKKLPYIAAELWERVVIHKAPDCLVDCERFCSVMFIL